MNITKKEMLQLDIDFEKQQLAETLKKAQQKAADFASEVNFAQVESESMNMWELTSMAQTMQQLMEKAKELRARIEAYENAMKLIED